MTTETISTSGGTDEAHPHAVGASLALPSGPGGVPPSNRRAGSGGRAFRRPRAGGCCHSPPRTPPLALVAEGGTLPGGKAPQDPLSTGGESSGVSDAVDGAPRAPPPVVDAGHLGSAPRCLGGDGQPRAGGGVPVGPP